MVKNKKLRTYIAGAFAVLWVGVIVYFVVTGEDGFLKGQVYSAPATCEEIVSSLSKPDATNVSSLVDAALSKDCSLPSELLQNVEQKILEEQKAGL